MAAGPPPALELTLGHALFSGLAETLTLLDAAHRLYSRENEFLLVKNLTEYGGLSYTEIMDAPYSWLRDYQEWLADYLAERQRDTQRQIAAARSTAPDRGRPSPR